MSIIGDIVGSVAKAVLPSVVSAEFPVEAAGPLHEPVHQASLATEASSGVAGLPLPPLPPHIAALAASQTLPVEGQGSGGSTGSGGGVSARESLRDPIVRAIAKHMGIPGWDSVSLAELIQGMKG